MLFLFLIPIIWVFYNERAFVFLLPIGIIVGIFIYQIFKLIKAKPMYGETHVIEFNNSKTTSGRINIPNVVFVKVKSHDLYQIKNNAIDYKNNIKSKKCSLQPINGLNSIIYNKVHIQFVLNIDNEINILEGMRWIIPTCNKLN
jgi:hypothetical protein